MNLTGSRKYQALTGEFKANLSIWREIILPPYCIVPKEKMQHAIWRLKELHNEYAISKRTKS